jgi:4-amino-4-deoxy-L-arabinose transferase-like glycosyltransferase
MKSLLPTKVSNTTILLLVIGIGAFLRALLAWHALRDLSIPRESDDYIGLAQTWHATGVYPNSHFLPLYPLLSRLFLQLFNHDIARAITSILIFQVILGALGIGLIYHIQKRVLSRTSYALAGAGLVAIDPLLVLQSAYLLTEPIYTFLLLLSIYLLICAIHSAGGSGFWKWPLLTGFTLGLASLTRSVGLIAVALALLLMVFNFKLKLRQKLSQGFILGLTVVLVLLPWSWHNYKTYGRFSISSSGPYNLAALVIGPAKSQYEGETPEANLKIWQADLEGSENEFELADQAASVAVEWALAHPIPTIRTIVGGQMKLLVAPWISQWSEILALEEDTFIYKLVYLFLLGIRLALFGLLGLGIYRLAVQNSSWARRLGVFFLLVIGFHMLASGGSGNARLVIPVTPYIDLFAATGVVYLIRNIRGVRLTRLLDRDLQTT